MSDVESRLVALEKAVRRWRYAAFVTGVVLLIGAIGAASAPDNVRDVLRARRIEVLAPDGEPAIVLRADIHGSSLSLTARDPNHRRMVTLAADQDETRLMLMKHEEAALFSVSVNDAGATLSLFDGREPSQRPRGIILRSACPNEDDERGGAGMMLMRGHKRSDVEASLSVRDPDGKASLMLGESGADDVVLRVDPKDGKLDFLVGRDKGREGSHP